MRIKVGLLLLLMLLLTSPLVLSAPEGQKVGEVFFVRGDAWLIRDGEKETITPASLIKGGDIIKTGDSAKVSMGLESGYVIEIKSRSEFMFDEPGAEAEEITSGIINVGVVYIKHRSRGAKKKKKRKDYHYLQIQTPSAVAGVRGTQFAVAVAPDGKGLLAVEDGQVGLSKGNGEEIKLNMRQKIEIPGGEGKISEKGITDYFPEQYSVEQWFAAARERALKNVGPVARRLVASVKDNIIKSEKIAGEILKLASEITRQARLAEKNRIRGQSVLYKRHQGEVRKFLPVLRAKVRLFIRLDNRIRWRGRMLGWLLEQAAEPDSPAPPVAKKLIKRHYSTFKKFETRLEELQKKRRTILREKIPEMKRAAGLISR